MGAEIPAKMTLTNTTLTENLKPKDILIIDYGVGNLLSITNALKFIGYNFKISDKKEDLLTAKAYLLPGVGAFGEAMNNLKKLGLIETLIEQVAINKKPILGICLGMQLLVEDSEENGYHKGLGLIQGHIVKIRQEAGLRVPQVGWNNLEIIKKDFLFSRIRANPHFYFDHSYQFNGDPSVIAAKCIYGGEITAAIQKENIFGVQFHPEKSQNNGLRLFRSFFEYLQNNNINHYNNNNNNNNNNKDNSNNPKNGSLGKC